MTGMRSWIGFNTSLASVTMIEQDSITDLPLWKEYFVDKPGLYRFQLVVRNNVPCAAQESLIIQYPAFFNIPGAHDGYCIHSQRIDRPSSEYIVKEWKWDTNYSQICL